MKIKFIGTGSGLTSLDRYHSSFLITSLDHKLLVDCGDGISRALLNQYVDYNSINSIIISHLHADHYAGLPSLITQMKLAGRKEKLSLYIHKSEIEFIEQFLQHSYLFTERLSFELEIIPFSEEGKINITELFSFVSKCNSHLEKYLVNKSSVKLSYVSLSFLFKDQDNSLIYSGDLGSDDDLFLFDEKVDWLITEITHIDPRSIIKLIDKNSAKQIIITHIDKISDDLLAIMDDNYNSTADSPKFIIALDGLELNHYRSGCL